jgi:hypothetical protein
MDSLDDETQFVTDHTEEKYYALFVYRGVPQSAKVYRRTEFGSLCFSPCEWTRSLWDIADRGWGWYLMF